MNPAIDDRWKCKRGHLLSREAKVCPICIDEDVFRKKPRGIKVRITCKRCFKEKEVPQSKATQTYCGTLCFQLWMKENCTAP